MPASTLSDGSELIEPIPCDRSGALAYLVLSIPNPKKPGGGEISSNAPLARIVWSAPLTPPERIRSE
jgi:hypothetical protein